MFQCFEPELINPGHVKHVQAGVNTIIENKIVIFDINLYFFIAVILTPEITG